MRSVRLAESAGFCFGVRRAVDMVYGLLETGERDICTLGPVIHNKSVIRDLEQRGVRVVDTPQQAAPGSVLVIRAHGVPRDVFDECERRGVRTVDTTCPFVQKIHRLVSQASKEGRTVLIVGHADHPEVQGIVGHCGRSFVVKDLEQLQALSADIPGLCTAPALMVAQTTLKGDVWQKCSEYGEKVYTNLIVSDTICNATYLRQADSVRLASECDAMIVLGSSESSNSNRLYELCREVCSHTYFCEQISEIPAQELAPYQMIGITAGASTPAYIIKEAIQTMEETNKEMLQNSNEEISFEQALEESFFTLNTGDRAHGVVCGISPTEVQVDLGTKQAAYIPVSELSDNPSADPHDLVKIGDEIEVFVVRVNDVEGTIMLSKKRIDAIKGWDEIEDAVEKGTIFEGTLTEVIKGGAIVLYNSIRVFVPASQLPGSRESTHEDLVGKTVRFKILEINRRRRRVIGSVRAVTREERKAAYDKFWAEAEVGKVYQGTVKSLTSYGAFVDLGGIDGMVHISELSWSRVKHPSDVLAIGDEVEVYILDLDQEKNRISLGYKKQSDNPWLKFESEFKEGDVIDVKVVKFMPFGAFAEVIPGIDGLIHISQIARQKIDKPASVLEIGQIVKVKIVSIDHENKKVNLSITAAMEPEAPVEETLEVVASTEEPVQE
ncbi:bifunctional 4-hydroxy-3-methylbut-2-enyl diphosphate reductase/30S ribosomal protein S1 [Feifania hominis]|uniref:4-hydroxy-3-methylbut-2-enyl diphosphate reductase n=1 Tax=Feifania hominis TaxID=2763660 RepID=A0A926DCE8_9FIRM|nr:bifunctional 4-hydroxy-3-methylbut-2-enyl diphosphate reductase/30S ribosomal protein S1 [Feifania hominis]MBC8535528.1 bifunctional 4-hydroxy-3-methylbut-2-enyl diphosphate reductase/30S ribosomal protein S1 [Feifania hominis]